MNTLIFEALEDGTVVWDGFDDALVGFGKVLRNGELREVAIYSWERMVDVLLKARGGDENDENAIAIAEYLQTNILNAYLGHNTPVVLIDSWVDGVHHAGPQAMEA